MPCRRAPLVPKKPRTRSAAMGRVQGLSRPERSSTCSPQVVLLPLRPLRPGPAHARTRAALSYHLCGGSYGAGEGMPERAPKKAPPQALQQQPAAARERTPRQGGSAGEPAAAARAVLKRLIERPAAQQARPTKTRRGEPGVLVALVRGSSGEGEGGIHTDVSIMQFNLNVLNGIIHYKRRGIHKIM